MEFQKFDKIPRLSRDIVITEKIDGTNAQVYIVNKENYLREHYNPDNPDMTSYAIEDIKKQAVYINEEFYLLAGSRKKWLDITSKGDNFNFAKWVVSNAEELIKLGEGRHYGEWYGLGIQRNYGLKEKKLALFNVHKWEDPEVRPKCCDVVPTLYTGAFDTAIIQIQLDLLANCGSRIVEGFKNPEGIVIYHTASARLFKKTIFDDEKPKEQVKNEI